MIIRVPSLEYAIILAYYRPNRLYIYSFQIKNIYMKKSGRSTLHQWQFILDNRTLAQLTKQKIRDTKREKAWSRHAGYLTGGCDI